MTAIYKGHRLNFIQQFASKISHILLGIPRAFLWPSISLCPHSGQSPKASQELRIIMLVEQLATQHCVFLVNLCLTSF